MEATCTEPSLSVMVPREEYLTTIKDFWGDFVFFFINNFDHEQERRCLLSFGGMPFQGILKGEVSLYR
jgi:hypothetical protein